MEMICFFNFAKELRITQKSKENSGFYKVLPSQERLLRISVLIIKKILATKW